MRISHGYFEATLVALAAMSVGACASAVRQQEEVAAANTSLDQAPVCCSSYDQLRYEPMVIGQALEYQHGPPLQAMMVDGSRSFVKAFALPDARRYLEIRISTRFSDRALGVDMLGRSTIFYPSLMFLDRNYKVVQSIERPVFHFNDVHFSEAPTLDTKLYVDQIPEGSRYVLIYSRKENAPGWICGANRLYFDVARENDCKRTVTPFASTGTVKVKAD